jgi:hypothetical protein
MPDRKVALALAQTRLSIHLRTVLGLADRGDIPAARMMLDDVMSDLDDIQGLLDAADGQQRQEPAVPRPRLRGTDG